MSQNQDLRERCSYLLILFKAKDKALFEKYSAQLAAMSAADSTEFYNYLLLEYKKLVEGPSVPAPVQKPVVKVETSKPLIAKKAQTKKKVAKKKVVPKKAVKKAVKKVPAKKKTAKKAAKKVTKKVFKKKSKKR